MNHYMITWNYTTVTESIVIYGSETIYHKCVDFHYEDFEESIMAIVKKKNSNTKIISTSIGFMRNVTEKEHRINVN